MHLVDIAQNALAAGASEVAITAAWDRQNRFTLRVADNGGGMDEATAQNAEDPFYTSRKTRSVGLGLPLLRMAAEQTGGQFRLSSAPGKGTQVEAVFCEDHIDCAPLGDIGEAVAELMQCNPETRFLFTAETPKNRFVVDSAELRAILGDVSLAEPAVAVWLRQYLSEQTSFLKDRSGNI